MKTFRKDIFMKRKFFTTLALFVSLAITACGGGNKGQEAKWESDKNGHWHVNEAGEKITKIKMDPMTIMLNTLNDDRYDMIWTGDDA